MNIEQVIQLADDLVFSHTEQHLDYLQKAIIKGTLEHKNYPEIAEEINCSESHVKNTGSELWQILSDAFGEDITKKNFRHILAIKLFFLVLLL
jgi:DNA-directed RNA polymerase specialized sigma24 family protein